MSSYFRQQLEEWLKTIEVEAGNVIDVGGAQLPIKGRTKSWDVNQYAIFDLPNPHDLKLKEGDIIQIYDGDIQTPIEKSNLNNLFDIAFCLEVAEYWFDPLTALKNINKFLKKDGILYISFPFIYPHHNPEGKDYLRYTRWGCQKLLKEAGFEILNIIPRVEHTDQTLYECHLNNWFSLQKMRPSKEYSGHNEVGYLIKCKKL